MEKTSKSPVTGPWDVLRAIARRLEGQILLAGLAFAIIFFLLIVSGRLPLEGWVVTLELFLVLVVIVLGAHLIFELRRTRPVVSVPPPQTEEEDQQRLIEALIERELLAIRERHFKRAIHKFDDKYWTNLDIHFLQLEQHDDLLDQLARLVTLYLKGDSDAYVVLDPIDFKAQLYTMGIVKKIAAKAGLRMVSIQELKSSEKLVVLAAVYSESLKRFINDFSSYIHLVIILLAPITQYLTNELVLPPKRVKTLVSLDSLAEIPEVKRKVMITGVVK